MNKKKKILFFCNTSKTVIDFRRELISYLIEQNYEIVVIVADDIYKKEILLLGVKKFYSINFNNRSINVFNYIKLKKHAKEIISLEKPDIVFTFQHKPNIVGSFTAKKAGVNKIFCMVEGLGDSFVRNSIKYLIARYLLIYKYKRLIKFVNKIFVLNKFDLSYFVHLFKSNNKLKLIKGIGIDTEKYNFCDINNLTTFFMAARLIKTKGIQIYLNVARKLKNKGLTFYLAGQESEFTKKDLEPYIKDGSIIYLGYLDSINEYLNKCTCFVLPTMIKEGMPRGVLEAMAIGRPIIGSNVAGLSDEVINGYNGFLLDPKDLETELESAILNFITLEKEKIIELGKNSRLLVEKEFDSNIINKEILDILEN